MSDRLPLRATYRVQVQGIGLARVTALLPYLDELGVDTVYLSPVFTATPGSTHGYDVVDPRVVDPALGGRTALDELLGAAADRGMRVLFDIVPNHMATHAANPYWWDVLRLGATSPWASMFDIDWEDQQGRVLLPVLGAPVGEVLQAGELQVQRPGPEVLDAQADAVVRYHERVFPLAPGTLDKVLGSAGDLESAGPLLGGRRGRPRSFDALEQLLDLQHYRLAYWRLSRSEGNYRRFFDIDRLVGVRQEDDHVYDETHRLVRELAASAAVAGVRVDHVDGLADPTGYLDRLRRDLDVAGGGRSPVLLVEKILARGEHLPPWPVDGTTGYEFADLAGGLFVDPAGATDLADLAEQAGGHAGDAASLEREGRRLVAHTLFDGQRRRLVTSLRPALASGREGRDLDDAAVDAAVTELLARLRVYRGYGGGRPASAEDRRYLLEASEAAGARLEGEGRRALQVLVGRLLGDRGSGEPRTGEEREAVFARWREPARRWQQLASAVAAKGVEDTAYYRFAGLLSAAEVGGSPAEPALSAADFHVAMAERQRLWPHSLNATSTHDSKRSEDMRCRLAVLSEMSGEWARAVGRWHRRFGPRLAGAGRQVAFDTELVVYQTVFGAWPLHDRRWEDFPDRIVRYVRKAAHEAKRETSWVRPDEAYEALLERFVRRLLGPDEPEFRREMARLVRRAAPAALANTLGLLALKVTAPGVPDFYQGAEDTLVALVDPDNRRPVDFDDLAVRLTRGAQWADAAPEERRAVVRELAAAGLAGDLKLFVTRQLLQSRRRQEELFAAGRYLPLATRGPGRDHVVAFARRRRRSWSVTVVPRCTVAVRGPGRPAVGDVWKSTSVVLPEGAPTSFRDVVTGTEIAARRGALAVRDLYAVLPVAVVLGDR